MTEIRYIFTVTAGRSGQSSLANLIKRHVPGCYPAFEEPGIKRYFPGVLGDLESRFRRNFIETNELLGRGKVLKAYESANHEFLENIAAKRVRMAQKQLLENQDHIYFDISKFFARGLHCGFASILPTFSLVRLVRDPLFNMRSFLNRGKNFMLDNSLPSSRKNILRLSCDEMVNGELYLWAWCEMYLRYDWLINNFNISHHVEIRTEDLSNPEKMHKSLHLLGLKHGEIITSKRFNTNFEQGHGATLIGKPDIEIFYRFIDRLPKDILNRLKYFDTYNPEENIY